ncbi:hypothetical protein PV05_08929 [Exophiala xenobiotica]|uniref:Aminopeptidase n=1 Tax=Exophiala xenobiotica TaxID=348802 RepID=A0A0D2F021_9EURO|nr:uncharacterized protein PV05_08929 [Exophiala xenobiotica]KIW53349.1 hypothetical protein PV05_08929 [Exophiala xenobiotica]
MLQEWDTNKISKQLAQTITPSNYHVSIFDIEFGGGWTYGGQVIIDADISLSADTIVLHCDELEIFHAEIRLRCDSPLVTCSASSIALNQDDKNVKISFPEFLPKGHVQLLVSFKGKIDRSMTGFYRAKYSPHDDIDAASVRFGADCYLLTTHFEPCDARKAFPCFDEPHLKATFELELEVPDGLTALSNMPEKSRRPGSKKGLKVVCFEKSPVMSTYLLAWAVGDFEYIEALTERTYSGKKIPVRIYTTKGLTQYAQFALRDACDALDFFSERFGVDYPLPKCDHLVVHEFISGAMENWGLITYKATKILFDPLTSDNRLMSKASYVIAHELAHQWFGNLVTMSGWTELWLNEGFATWAGFFAVDHLHPEWNIWGQFVDEAMEDAFALDSLEASHPIQTDVKNDAEVHQMFDSISYCKGSSVIRMLVSHLGESTFLKGIKAYLGSRLYGNATSDDLWSALSQASGLGVEEMMGSWIHQAGFPLLNVDPTPDGLKLAQRPCTSEMQHPADTLWYIPLGLETTLSAATCNMLATKSGSIKQTGAVSKVNHNHAGFYRTQYPLEYLVSLRPVHSKLSTEDKVGIISDMRFLVLVGLKSSGELLSLLLVFKHERDCFVWSQIKKSMSMVLSAVSKDVETAAAIKAYIRNLVDEVKHEISWTGCPDSYVKGELEKILIQVASMADDESVLCQINQRFRDWKNDNRNSINRNLQTPIFGVSVEKGGEQEYQDVKAEYIENHSIDGREICIAAMGRTSHREMARDLLDFTFLSDRHIALQNIHFVGMALANGPCGSALWDYVKQNWETVYERLSVNSVALNWFIENSLSSFDEPAIEKDITAFFATRMIPDLAHPLRVARDNIKRNAAYTARAVPEVRQWLHQHEYL